MNTVLVVDDDDNVVETLKVFLRREGYRVVVASDGKAGLKAAKKRGS